MKLAAWADPDTQGISTYPKLLMSLNAAEKVHIADADGMGPLCGVGGQGNWRIVEYLGRRRPVCVACRVHAEAEGA